MSRLLGEKKTREDDLQLITASEFFLQYPSLCESIERVLVSAVDQVKAGRFSVPDSTLMPVLSLMMRLGSGPDIPRCSRYAFVLLSCSCFCFIIDCIQQNHSLDFFNLPNY